MPFRKPEYQILVCNSFRVAGEAKGVCNARAHSLVQVLEEEIIDRGIDAQICTTGCLKMCDAGPIMVVQPQNWWFGKVDEDAIDKILDDLEEGECCEEYLIEDA